MLHAEQVRPNQSGIVTGGSHDLFEHKEAMEDDFVYVVPPEAPPEAVPLPAPPAPPEPPSATPSPSLTPAPTPDPSSAADGHSHSSPRFPENGAQPTQYQA